MVKDYVFQNAFLKLLDEHIPVKNKFLKAIHEPYKTKAFMKRSELKSKYFKNKQHIILNYIKIRKTAEVNHIKKERKRCHNNMNLTNFY